jgi:2-polyprenyl-6-methoxyphenol hydroxylase-like FAD-dependent oxidoreductase
MTEINVDVVIVGGGLAGSALGAALVEDGRSVLLLERLTKFEDRVRGEWLAPWGVVEAKRVNVFASLVAAGGHTISRSATYDELDLTTGTPAPPLPLTALLPGVEGPLCLEHVVMQNTLIERAASCGVDVRRGVSAIEISAGTSPEVRFAHEGTSHTARCRLIVGADGRTSTVRRQAGIEIHENPIDHLLAGLLVEGADDWPEDLQATGQVGDIYYLIFPQGGGKVRLYADYSADQKGRFSGPDGAKKFLENFDMACVPNSKSIASATPVGPCASFPSQDAWTDEPFTDGVVLIGDAAGYNDPIIGQGMSITLRDVRIVRELIRDADDFTPDLFLPYAEERSERLRRLRISAMFVTEWFARFGEEANKRRIKARERMLQKPELGVFLFAVFVGPDMMPEDAFSEERVESIFAI